MAPHLLPSSPHDDAAVSAEVVSSKQEADMSLKQVDLGYTIIPSQASNESDCNSFVEELEDDPESISSESTLGRNNSGKQLINRRDNQLVNCSKMFVVLTVSVLAAIVAFSTYFYVKETEDSNYASSYDIVVDEIASACRQRLRVIFDNLESVSVSLTTQANLAKMEWPFVVFPDFQVQGMIFNQMTGAATLTLHPIVSHSNRSAWETFSVENLGWMERAHVYYDQNVDPSLYDPQRPNRTVGSNTTVGSPTTNESLTESGITPYIWKPDQEGNRQEDDRHGVYFPAWQKAPAEDFWPTVNLNFADVNAYAEPIREMFHQNRPVLTAATSDDYNMVHYDGLVGPELGPRSYLLQPVYDTLLADRNMVAFLSADVGWTHFLQGSVPASEKNGVILVVRASCDNQTMSFQVSGSQVVFLGDEDFHDPIFDQMRRDFQLDHHLSERVNGTDTPPGEVVCQYTVTTYPTFDYAEQFLTDMPVVYAVFAITCFLIATICFALYDWMVQRRQRKLLEAATKTNAIVSNLFPSNVRDRLLEELTPADPPNHATPKNPLHHAAHQKPGQVSSVGGGDMSQRHNDGTIATSEAIFGSKPIADLFPSTTIMFADMVGFTAWSSTREPAAVFTLLETVYHSFDMIARKRRVFKVETVGDCYVAVCGLPLPRKDHAVVMMRFASDCLIKMGELTSQLEKTLGPDTAELGLRTGLHSGQVTAGVLRGEKGRFQLFGDTMNTASRLESTGLANKIHISQETADLLIAAGKSKWIIPREDKIHAKGKGELQTYWLKIDLASNGSSKSLPLGAASDSEIGSSSHDLVGYSRRRSPSPAKKLLESEPSDKTQRLIDYSVDILVKLLHQIIVYRKSNPPKMATRSQRKTFLVKSGPVLDEVKDILELPHFDPNVFKNSIDPESFMISPRVHQQLASYVAKIARLYRSNPFHNFEHASHVTMSVTKLLGRIVNPDVVRNRDGTKHQIAQEFHDHTFGITSDPLTHFACVLSALIHDADHPGVSNAVLVSEKDPLALKYKNKSIAEQNSVELAWDTLMVEEFNDLRACIYCNEEEFHRFRQVLVNIVLATDIMDKELGSLRKERWEKAFTKDSQPTSNSSQKGFEEVDDPHTRINRKATIVLEHLIQASDVSHTMQHWHVYLKWNERLFHEMYLAYLDGRVETNPAEGWYRGEIGFFDFYVIPLAKKLETCGVFGVSSDEYLNYAKANRSEWEAKGEAMVAKYLKTYETRVG